MVDGSLDPDSPTYRQIVDMGLSTAPFPINDWVQVPGTGDIYLWSIGEDTTASPTESVFMRWNITTTRRQWFAGMTVRGVMLLA